MAFIFPSFDAPLLYYVFSNLSFTTFYAAISVAELKSEISVTECRPIALCFTFDLQESN